MSGTGQRVQRQAEAPNRLASDAHVTDHRLATSSTTPRLKQERDFIEATSKLGSYKLQSRRHAGLPLLPAEIRETENRMELIALLLSLNDDAYKAWESILELAVKLNAGSHEGRLHAPPARPKVLVEIQALAMLSESAIAAEDFDRAQEMAKRMVTLISGLRKRAAAAAASKRLSRGPDADAEDHTQQPAMTASQMLPEAEELGWKVCYQLARHPAFADERQRLQFMGHAVSFCPKEQIPSMTRKWQQTYEQATAASSSSGEKQQELFFVSDKLDSRTTASSALGSLVDAYTSPFASLLANAGTRAAPRKVPHVAGMPPAARSADGAAARAPVGGFGGRAAQLFDTLGAARAGGVEAALDPAERAARAARNFFGGLTGHASAGAAQPREGAQPEPASTTYGSGAFSFSRGVGWLLGEEERKRGTQS